MKEASGELNMTVVTVVAIAAIGGLLWFFWPTIIETIEGSFGATSGKCSVGEYWNGSECVSNGANKKGDLK